MPAQLDHGAIGSLLRHFRSLSPDSIDQDQGIIYTHNLSSSLLFERCACRTELAPESANPPL